MVDYVMKAILKNSTRKDLSHFLVKIYECYFKSGTVLF